MIIVRFIFTVKISNLLLTEYDIYHKQSLVTPYKQRKRLRRFFFYMIFIRFFRNEFLNFGIEIQIRII